MSNLRRKNKTAEESVQQPGGSGYTTRGAERGETQGRRGVGDLEHGKRRGNGLVYSRKRRGGALDFENRKGQATVEEGHALHSARKSQKITDENYWETGESKWRRRG